MTRHKIAVCIPTYNQETYLRQAVESVLVQTRQPEEIWISDDASTDDTEKLCRDLCAISCRIRYTRQDQNLGMGGNPNWLLRQPQTEFVAKLDSDDYYESDYLEKLTTLLLRFPQAGYAHAAVYEVNESSSVKRTRRLVGRTSFMNAEDSLRALVKGYRVAANVILFRSEALESVNYWRADMAFADDWDLAVRLADAGWGNCYCEDVLANYRVWSDAGGYRCSRRLAEIDGIRRVFEESMLPAFVSRGWPTYPLTTARKRFAAAQARALMDASVSKSQRSELLAALKALGDGWRLAIISCISRSSCASRLYLQACNLRQNVQDVIKAVLVGRFKARSRL